ncbi:MAG: N-acetylmuramoyl-L-alanine amidase [Lachnospiraceae bacterium]|nr:N-acetylmuramoyl-L-alanine amidase [Lachnospiraceae bacterium]
MSKIVIDAGHGINTAGKRCLKSLDPNETREWVLNARVADALEIYLQSAGHATLRVDDTSGNADVLLATRVKAANEWKADYYASIHHNAGINGGTGGGTIVFAYPGTSGETVKVQEAIYKRTIARAGLKGNRSDGTITADFYVLRKTIMSASLIECGFMDSASDIKYILNPEWSRKMALGIAEGICEVFGGTVKEEKRETVKVMSAKSFDENFAGTYKATIDDLKLCTGANDKYDVLDSIPKDGKVRCYGYYTKESNGSVWLYVVYNGQIGFVSKRYLL